MTPIKHTQLIDTTLGHELQKANVIVTEIEDLSGKVPHAAAGGAAKSSYVSPKSGRTIYILERNSVVPPDSYTNDVWQFDTDFTAEEAAQFLKDVDAIPLKR